MLLIKDIKIELRSQGFEAKQFGFSPNGDSSVIMFKSIRKTSDTFCPVCGGQVHIYDSFQMNIKDIPLWTNIPLTLFCSGYRYRCKSCGKSFTEEIPFVYPGTRITYRAANWIKGFLNNKLSIRAIQNLTGIHWETIRKVQQEVIDEALEQRQQELRTEGYKPRYLAVDEFAIHKGHSYATCVMDLETGDILWVGKGRSINDFEKFFMETDSDTLSAVIAVAMDMNASYNKLVEKYLPNADIVYDRYHMQAQFGKDVLGVVRLYEARKHKSISKGILAEIDKDTDKDIKRDLKQQVKTEIKEYSKLKKARWTLLMNSSKISGNRSEHLKEILENHHDLAVCYAMKEEMCELFALTDTKIAEQKWQAWFDAASASEIPALVKFAELKERRIPGLVAHASHQISTGKLEGFNNKIKVAKRIGYGYRNEEFFFSLIRYLSLPSVRQPSPNFP
jgi:transposase